MAGSFSFDLGTHQGRIASITAEDGSYVYELGHANRVAEWVNVGDYHEVKQDVVIDPEAAFLRVNVRITPPDVLSEVYSWKLTARLNGVVRATRIIDAGELTKTLEDFAIPLALANAPPTSNEIAFRLELI